MSLSSKVFALPLARRTTPGREGEKTKYLLEYRTEIFTSDAHNGMYVTPGGIQSQTRCISVRLGALRVKWNV